MKTAAATKLETRTIDQLAIEDEKSFRHVALYAELKTILTKSKYPFRLLPNEARGRWDRALLLNLTFWGNSAGGDVLERETLAADVVCHVAWHHLASRALAEREGAPQSAEALFFGEAIASAFDVYLVGRLLGHAPRSSFLETQVPAMAEATDAAGLDEDAFEAILAEIASDPDRAFEDLRALLFDATTALLACHSAEEGYDALARFDAHRFAPLLHRYELSNWVLYARSYASHALGPDPRVRAIDDSLRSAKVSLDWLTDTWVTPALR